MALSVIDVMFEIQERLQQARAGMQENRVAGVNTPGFNQELGRHDALGELLEWIEDNR